MRGPAGGVDFTGQAGKNYLNLSKSIW